MGSSFLGVPLGYKSKPDWVQPPDAEDRTSGGVEGSREVKARDPIRSFSLMQEMGVRIDRL